MLGPPGELTDTDAVPLNPLAAAVTVNGPPNSNKTKQVSTINGRPLPITRASPQLERFVKPRYGSR
jgi:hypothetical protein